MAYAKSIFAGLVAVAVFEIVLFAVSLVIISSEFGYWKLDLRLLSTWQLMLPTLLSFAAGFGWVFRRESKRVRSAR